MPIFLYTIIQADFHLDQIARHATAPAIRQRRRASSERENEYPQGWGMTKISYEPRPHHRRSAGPRQLARQQRCHTTQRHRTHRTGRAADSSPLPDERRSVGPGRHHRLWRRLASANRDIGRPLHRTGDQRDGGDPCLSTARGEPILPDPRWSGSAGCVGGRRRTGVAVTDCGPVHRCCLAQRGELDERGANNFLGGARGTRKRSTNNIQR